MTTDTDELAISHSRAGRRAIWVAVAVAVGWLVVGGVAGPLSGRLSEVSTNDNASFLSASAESTLAANEQASFAENDVLPLLVVITPTNGGVVTTAEAAAAATFAERIPGLPVEQSTIGQYTDAGPLVPFPSEDGMALLIAVPLNAEKAGENTPSGELALAVITEAIRDAAVDVPGLRISVTGPAGILTDLIAIFGAIDTALLGATAVIVAIILIFVYRSPFIWVIPLLGSLMALTAANAIVYFLASSDVLLLNGQSQGILTVLVFGAATDYALLMIARYREELHHEALHTDAIKAAWRGTVEPIVASGATVIIGLMCLLLSELNSNRSLGPVGAVGILAALLASLTFLPALLAIPSAVLPILAFLAPTVLGLGLSLVSDIEVGPFAAIGGIMALGTILAWVVFGCGRLIKPEWGPFSRVRFPPGRWAFWPKVPHEDDIDERLSGIWSRLAGSIGRRSRRTWVLAALVMLLLAGFSTTLRADGITTTQAFVNDTDSVVGQAQLAEHFAGGLGTPTIVIANEGAIDDVLGVTKQTPGVADVAAFTGVPRSAGDQALPPKVVDGRVQLLVTLLAAADSPEAEETVQQLRTNVHRVDGADALVGGQTAAQLDVDTASLRDRNLIIPVVLVVILLVLVLLLRSLAAPLLLMGTVVLSYFATLGICALFFNNVFGFAGADTSFPLFAFVFLVALGVDYNIFLMTRVREESLELGTRPGILKGLTVTGGVITSAGLVLAATFLVLGVLPLVFLREIGFAVAVGVLLDTFIIRSTLVPALSYDIGARIWWPSRLAKAPERSSAP